MSNKSSLLAVGTVALDTIQTPMGRVQKALGGSAVYFAAAARLYAPVRLVGVVGGDFPDKYFSRLDRMKITTDSVVVKEGKTFHWDGYYEGDLNQAVTRNTHLNVLATFKPQLSETDKRCTHLFLANIAPSIQLDVLNQIPSPHLVACDTMNYWIQSAKSDLVRVFTKTNIAFINDAEIRECSGQNNLLEAARWLMALGPSIVLVKKGEHGVLCVTRKGTFTLPAFPVDYVTDPTGAGDSFAGGFLGFMSRLKKPSLNQIKRAAVTGAIMASYNVQSFSIDRLEKIRLQDIASRMRAYQKMLRF
jgi:sugar/nucleoside kinase (ribokinase family)